MLNLFNSNPAPSKEFIVTVPKTAWGKTITLRTQTIPLQRGRHTVAVIASGFDSGVEHRTVNLYTQESAEELAHRIATWVVDHDFPFVNQYGERQWMKLPTESMTF